MWYAKVVCEVFDCALWPPCAATKRNQRRIHLYLPCLPWLRHARLRDGGAQACRQQEGSTEPPEDIPAAAAKNSGGSRAGAGRKPEKLGLGAAKTTGTQLSLGALSGMVLVCQTTFDCLGRVF